MHDTINIEAELTIKDDEVCLLYKRSAGSAYRDLAEIGQIHDAMNDGRYIPEWPETRKVDLTITITDYNYRIYE